MQKSEKERVVAELTERLRTSETLIVADYRGLTNAEIDGLRTQADRARRPLRGRQEHAHPPRGRGRRRGCAARAARGPVGDRVRRVRRRSRRGGEGAPRRGHEHEGPRDPRRRARGRRDVGGRGREPRQAAAGRRAAGAARGAIVSPLTTVVALLSAPLRDLVGLIDARIEQLKEQGDTSAAAGGRPAEARARGRAPELRPSRSPSRRGESEQRRAQPPTDRHPKRPLTRRRSRSNGNGYREGARDARQDDRARARRAEEQDRGGVGRHRRRSDGGRGPRRRRRAAAGAAAAEEKTSFDVVITAAGDKKIQVIKVVRAVTGPRPQGGEGPRRRRPRHRQGGREPGGGRLDQGAAGGGRRQRRAEVSRSIRPAVVGVGGSPPRAPIGALLGRLVARSVYFSRSIRPPPRLRLAGRGPRSLPFGVAPTSARSALPTAISRSPHAVIREAVTT